jgi:L-malate glycosyltransferase
MIIHQFRPISGGAELQAERLSAKLVKLGHSVDVLTRLLDDSPIEEISNGVRIMRVSIPLAYGFSGNQVVETFRYLVKNHNNYEIFHAHQSFGHAMVAVIVARCFKKKCVIKLACSGEYGDLQFLSTLEGAQNAMEVLRKADAVIAISSEVEEELLNNGFSANRIHRIPNGVDTKYFSRTKAFSIHEKFRFILIGRRHPQKGIDIALQALCQLKEQGLSQRVELKLYGRDFEGYDYQKTAMDLGVNEMVKFLPFSENIFEVYQSAHGFILPSRGEGLSNSLLESMSMELPVIATAVSGTVDVIENGHDGVLISPDSPDELAQAMKSFIQDSEFALRLGKKARQKVYDKFSLDFVAKKYSELYHELCS